MSLVRCRQRAKKPSRRGRAGWYLPPRCWAAWPMSVVRDPTAEGWLVACAFGVAATLCLIAWRRERRAANDPKHFPLLWLVLGSALLLLTINKQLDLHNVITAAGRHVVCAAGFWEARRLFQASFVVGLGVAAVCAAGLLIRTRGPLLIRLPFACCGIVMLSAFVVLRAASFHHLTDPWPALSSAGYRMRPLLELGGAFFIAVDAGRVFFGPRHDPPSDAHQCHAMRASGRT